MKTPRIFLVAVGERRQYGQFNPPIGLLYLGAWLRKRFSVEIRVVSQLTDNLSNNDLISLIGEFDSDIVCLSCMTPYAYLLPTLVEGIRAVSPHAIIVLGGAHVSAYSSQVLDEIEADMAVEGEGEIALEMIVDAWLGNGDYEDIPGLIRRTKSGDVLTNPGTTPIVEFLDDLPFPAYDLIDIKKYWQINAQMLLPYPRRYVMMFTSRGCPYACNYCSNAFGTRFRAHSAERIVEEICFYAKQYHIDEVMFYDDCFNLDSGRVLKYCELLLENHGPVKMVFPNGVRTDILDETVIDHLVEAGMYCCHFSLETASTRLQKFTGKNLNIQNFLTNVEYAVSKRVFASGHAMLGFPTETEEELLLTIRTSTNSELHTIAFFTVTPWPNTSLTKYVKEHTPEKLANISFENLEYWSVRINLSEVPDKQFFKHQRNAYVKFYSQPGRLYRIIRDYPKPIYLPTRLPSLAKRLIKR